MSLDLLDPSTALDEMSFWFVVSCWGFVAGCFLGVAACTAWQRYGNRDDLL